MFKQESFRDVITFDIEQIRPLFGISVILDTNSISGLYVCIDTLRVFIFVDFSIWLFMCRYDVGLDSYPNKIYVNCFLHDFGLKWSKMGSLTKTRSL